MSETEIQKEKETQKEKEKEKEKKADEIPVSHHQLRLWLDCQRSDPRRHNLISIHSFEGELSKEKLEESFKKVISNNEVLTHYFYESKGKIYQKSDLTATERCFKEMTLGKETFEEKTRKKYCKNFDLSKAPLIKGYFIADQKTEKKYFMIICHHLLIDALSTFVFFKQLSALYNDFPSKLVFRNKTNLVDYLKDEQLLLKTRETVCKEYWKRRLVSCSLDHQFFPISLKNDVAKENKETNQNFGQRYRFSLNPRVAFSLLKKLTINNVRISIFEFLASALSVLLYKYSNEKDIVFGYSSGMQYRRGSFEKYKELMCFMVNDLPFRIPIERDSSFEQHLLKVHNLRIADRNYQDYPLDSLINSLNSNNLFDGFQISLAQSTFASPLLELKNIKCKVIDYQIPTFDEGKLAFLYEATKTGLEFAIDYHSKSFSRQFINYISVHLLKIIETYNQNSQILISEINILSEFEMKLLLKISTGINTQRIDSKDPININQNLTKNINEKYQERGNENDLKIINEIQNKNSMEEKIDLINIWIQNVFQNPNSTCLIDYSKTYSYLEIAKFVSLLSKELKPLQRVVVYLDPSRLSLISLLTTLTKGSCYIPIDPEYPDERTEYILKDCNVNTIFTEFKYSERIKKIIQKIDSLNDNDNDNDKDKENDNDNDNDNKSKSKNNINIKKLKIIYLDQFENAIDFQKDFDFLLSTQSIMNLNKEIAYIIYTSGTTGKPKGVLITYGNISMRIVDLINIYSLNGFTEVFLLLASTSFDASLEDLLLPIVTKNSLIISPRDELFDIKKIIKLISKYKITHLNHVPSYFEMFIKFLEKNINYQKYCKSINRIICGGENLSMDLSIRILKIFTDQKFQLFNMYGPTEITIDASYKIINPITPSSSVISIGKPLPNTQVLILDSNLKLCPFLVKGEIYLAGLGLSLGYLNNLELTKLKFIPNPFEKDGLIFKTGDFGRYLLNGDIEFLGRKDNQIKIKGHRIELNEIEIILNQHKFIENSIVIPNSAETPTHLVAFIIKRKTNNNNFNQKTIIDYLKQYLPFYMIPNQFNLLKEFPLTFHGKIDRKELQKILPTSRSMKEIIKDNFLDCENSTIKNLKITNLKNSMENIFNLTNFIKESWRILFNKNQIDLNNDNFLNTININFFKINQFLNILQSLRIPRYLIFKYPTITKLIETILDFSIDDINKNNNQLIIPLSFSQNQLLFLFNKNQLNKNNYNIKLQFNENTFNLQILKKSLEIILNKYKILKINITNDKNGNKLLVDNLNEKNDIITFFKIKKFLKKEIKEEIHLWCNKELDIGKDKLFKICLFNSNDKDYFLIFKFNIVLIDNYSRNKIVKDFISIYNFFLNENKNGNENENQNKNSNENETVNKIKTNERENITINKIKNENENININTKKINNQKNKTSLINTQTDNFLSLDFICWQKLIQNKQHLKNNRYYNLQIINNELQELNTKKYFYNLDSNFLIRLKNFSNKLNINYFQLMITLFAIYISQITGNNDICIFSKINNRETIKNKKIQQIIGLMEIIFPFSFNFQNSNDLLIISLLKKYQKNINNIFNNKKNIRNKILLNQRNNQKKYFFKIINPKNLSTDENDNEEQEKGNDCFKREIVTNCTLENNFQLSLIIDEINNKFRFIYQTSIYNKQKIEKLTGNLISFCNCLIKDHQDLTLSEYSLKLNKSIHKYPIIKRQDTLININISQYLNPIKLLKNNRKTQAINQNINFSFVSPDKNKNMKKNLNWKQLDEQSDIFANYLISLNIKQNEKIGVLFRPSIKFIIILFSILKINCCILPIDITFPKRKIKKILLLSKVKYLINPMKKFNNFKKDQLANIQYIIFFPINEILQKKFPLDGIKHFQVEKGQVGEKNISIINTEKEKEKEIEKENKNETSFIFSNNSKNLKPELIKTTLQNIISNLISLNKKLNISNNEIILKISNQTDQEFINEIFFSLLFGNPIIFLNSNSQNKNTLLNFDNTLINVIKCDDDYLMDIDICKKIFNFDSVTKLILRSNFNVNNNFQANNNTIIKNIKLCNSKKIKIFNIYGTFETNQLSSLNLINHQIQNKENSNININQCIVGKPLLNSLIYILDSNLKLCPFLVKNEIYLGGLGLSLGYLNNLELTKLKFIPNPFEKDGLIFKTGDFGRYLLNGDIEFLGRKDNQIKIKGHRIELNEIEIILNQHKFIENSIVIPNSIENPTHLIAIIETNIKLSNNTKLNTVNKINKQIIMDYLTKYFPFYMHPKKIIFKQNLPIKLLNNYNKMKIQKYFNKIAHKNDYKGIKDNNDKNDETILIVPQNENKSKTNLNEIFKVMKTIEEIWKELLKIDSIDPFHNNFFQIGGNSMMVVELIHRIQNKLGKKIKPSTFFSNPTIIGILESLDYSLIPKKQNHYFQLQNDLQLDPEIKPKKDPQLIENHKKVLSQNPKIFITGGNGFLGSSILFELVKKYPKSEIYCGIRGTDIEHATSRLKYNLQKYSIKINMKNIKILNTDLTEPFLGLEKSVFLKLAQEIDLIFHCAANISLVESYESIRKVNVQGTIEMLKLACLKKLKIFCYISTISILSFGTTLDKIPNENSQLKFNDLLLHSGYVTSKFVAENLVRTASKRGLPAIIFRPGRIGWNSRNGCHNEKDLLIRFLKTCIKINNYPKTDVVLEFTPVDFIANQIINLLQAINFGKTFHLIDRIGIKFSKIISLMGSSVKIVEIQKWRQLIQKHNLGMLISLIEMEQLGNEEIHIDNEFTIQNLKKNNAYKSFIHQNAFKIFLNNVMNH
ncbi:hypothetical protein M0812_07257 [Anaeramoeba flamelloides]|uniref:Carrier domain-containing protein n=1 Tax=Anaeramoeba flamelloides TaxID=1746091 RepID=A0AAV8A4N9_9EUKA|nr:hypothetical protein M0812_07257 [Anaeramoeba flamelloides]